jgi:hypothetical protein
MYVECNMEALLHEHCCSGKAIKMKYSECVFVALVTQNAKRVRRIVFCGLSVCAIFLSPLCHKLDDFWKKKLNVKYVFWFCVQFLSETFMSEILSYLFIGLRVRYPILLSDFNWNLNFLDRLLKIPRYQICCKIRPVAAELFHADGWRDGQTWGSW